MKKNFVVASVFAGVLLIGGSGYWIGKIQSNRTPKDGAVAGGLHSTGKTAPGAPGAAGGGIAVETTEAKPVRMAQGLTAVGSMRSDESVTIRPEVSGRISDIGFREGQRVQPARQDLHPAVLES